MGIGELPALPANNQLYERVLGLADGTYRNVYRAVFEPADVTEFPLAL